MPESPETPTPTHATVRPDEVDWDERYRSEDQMWSGHVNGSLVDEVAELTPGRALDVGCGEGADAIWLAERGWTVTALDIAPTAVERGRAEAERRGLAIEWSAGDVLAEPPTGPFDLVSLQYPAFPVERRDEVVRALTGALAPGGQLLVVGHAFPEDPASIPFDPTDWVQPHDLIAALPGGFTVELDETRPRPGDHHHHAGSPHTEDVVVRIVRT